MDQFEENKYKKTATACKEITWTLQRMLSQHINVIKYQGNDKIIKLDVLNLTRFQDFKKYEGRALMKCAIKQEKKKLEAFD